MIYKCCFKTTEYKNQFLENILIKKMIEADEMSYNISKQGNFGQNKFKVGNKEGEHTNV